MNIVSQSPDIVIVGNGIMGLSLAFELRVKDPNISIVVIGPKARKNAATTAAGAMINVFAELADGQFDDPALKARASLSLNAYSLWDGLCERLSDHGDVDVAVKWGTYLYKTPGATSQEEKTLALVRQTIKKHDLESQKTDSAALPWYNPKSRMGATAMLEMPDGRIDPVVVLDAFERVLSALGVKIIDDAVLQLEIADQGRAHTITLKNSGEQISSANIVLANGSFAQELIDQNPALRAEIPRLLWGSGAALTAHFADWIKRMGGLDPNIFKLDKVVRTLVRDNACGLHVVPRDDGSFYIGASAAVLAEFEEYPRLHAVESLMQRAVDEISKAFFFAGIQTVGPGHRPVSVDCFPLLGQTHVPGIWFSNGMKRDGFTCSPYVSRELATQMLGGQSGLPEVFRPSRPLISYKEQSAAIEETVVADLQGELMHGMQLSAYGEQNYLSARRQAVETIYRKRDIEGFGIHPEVVHLYDNDDYYNLINHPRAAPLSE